MSSSQRPNQGRLYRHPLAARRRRAGLLVSHIRYTPAVFSPFLFKHLPLQPAFEDGHVPALPCPCLGHLHMGNHFMGYVLAYRVGLRAKHDCRMTCFRDRTNKMGNSEPMGPSSHIRCLQPWRPRMLCDLLCPVPCFDAQASQVGRIVSVYALPPSFLSPCPHTSLAPREAGPPLSWPCSLRHSQLALYPCNLFAHHCKYPHCRREDLACRI